MSNSRKSTRPRGGRRRNRRSRVIARRRTGVAPRRGGPHAVRPQPADHDARAIRLDVPVIPETAGRDIHVLCVSLHGETPPTWRLLEVPSSMTLDRLRVVLHLAFEWYVRGPHSFVTVYGEFFGLKGPISRAAWRTGEPRDESGVALAQAAGEDGLGMVYLCGYRDEWRVDIRVAKILPAAAGVAYPRCTGGRGAGFPGEESLEELTEDLAPIATVIVPSP
jgi:Plasmid pRiA4b ORF-3-like protein